MKTEINHFIDLTRRSKRLLVTNINLPQAIIGAFKVILLRAKQLDEIDYFKHVFSIQRQDDFKI